MYWVALFTYTHTHTHTHKCMNTIQCNTLDVHKMQKLLHKQYVKECQNVAPQDIVWESEWDGDVREREREREAGEVRGRCFEPGANNTFSDTVSDIFFFLFLFLIMVIYVMYTLPTFRILQSFSLMRFIFKKISSEFHYDRKSMCDNTLLILYPQQKIIS